MGLPPSIQELETHERRAETCSSLTVLREGFGEQINRLVEGTGEPPILEKYLESLRNFSDCFFFQKSSKGNAFKAEHALSYPGLLVSFEASLMAPTISCQ